MVRFLSLFVARLDVRSDGIRLLPPFTYATACISTEAKIRVKTCGYRRRQRLSSYFTARSDHVRDLPEHVCCGTGNDSIVPHLLHLYAFPRTMLLLTHPGAPLMVDRQQRDTLLQMLLKMETDHAWPTIWIVESLKREWKRT